MDRPENYYAILGVPAQADNETVKHAYRQLARRYHPDIAGEEGAIEMKRINRAYSVLSDVERRRNYDTILGGVIDLRQGGFARPRPRPHSFDPSEDIEFSGLNFFSSKGPLTVGTTISSSLGVVTSLNSAHTGHGLLIAAGSLDGKGMVWQITDDTARETVQFAADPTMTVESLRELRFSSAGRLLAGWGRLHLHVWDSYSGSRLWSYPLLQRTVPSHFAIDIALMITPDGQHSAQLALPYLPSEENRAPSAWGVRGTDIVTHAADMAPEGLDTLFTCTEENFENRRFWAIRSRSLSEDGRALVTLSCAQLPHEKQETVIARRWDLTSKARLSSKPRPHITTSLALGHCADSTTPYAVTTDATTVAYVSMTSKILLCDMLNGTYSEIPSGTMGSSSKLAISPDSRWLAVAREDSEINEGVIDLWSIPTGQLIQKFYHPWQISALTFAGRQMIVALTDGTIQVWK
ncbi:MAG TPA: DnaJ domain-containing protein [Ktedonobacteraceae bacterium]|jgi:WD40 repeat protein|nr:DnaJ domain-containing protein [Ktedonobacteraceae bacterium]